MLNTTVISVTGNDYTIQVTGDYECIIDITANSQAEAETEAVTIAQAELDLLTNPPQAVIDEAVEAQTVANTPTPDLPGTINTDDEINIYDKSHEKATKTTFGNLMSSLPNNAGSAASPFDLNFLAGNNSTELKVITWANLINNVTGQLKINTLTPESSPDLADVLQMYDTSAGANRAVTVGNLLALAGGGGGEEFWDGMVGLDADVSTTSGTEVVGMITPELVAGNYFIETLIFKDNDGIFNGSEGNMRTYWTELKNTNETTIYSSGAVTQWVYSHHSVWQSGTSNSVARNTQNKILSPNQATPVYKGSYVKTYQTIEITGTTPLKIAEMIRKPDNAGSTCYLRAGSYIRWKKV
jgi:hypothetical protein